MGRSSRRRCGCGSMLLTSSVPDGEERLDVAERIDSYAQLAELLRAACASLSCASRRSCSGPECSASSYAVVSAIASAAHECP